MLKPAEYGIPQTEAGKSVATPHGVDGSQQTQIRKALYPTNDFKAGDGRSVEIGRKITLTGLVVPQQKNVEWDGTETGEANLARDGNCLDETGVICPKFAKAREERVLAERQRIELTHRVVNVLQVLMTRIERQRRMQVDPALKDELGKLVASAHASAQLHQYLLPPRKFVHLDVAILLRKLALAIEGATGLHCDVDAEPLTMPGQVAVELAAVVNELAWNAYKHGYGGEEGGVIRIVCRRYPDGRLLLSVSDQGRGLPTGFDPSASEGFGLMVVFATARQLGGEIRFESGQGASFTLLLPVLCVEER